jgi:hypothetical protein
MTRIGEMTGKELDDALGAIAKRAKDLRDAGVTGRISIGDVAFELSDPEPSPALAQSADESRGSPIDDPETFGGYLPSRRRPPKIDDEE